MKKVKRQEADELRPEYTLADLKHGVRGKYFKRYQEGTNLVLLSPDVAVAFPNDESVNDALRSLMRVAKQATGLTGRSTGRARKRGAPVNS